MAEQMTLEEVEAALVSQERELDYMLSNVPDGPDELVPLLKWNARLGTLLRQYQENLLEEFILRHEGEENAETD